MLHRLGQSIGFFFTVALCAIPFGFVWAAVTPPISITPVLQNISNTPTTSPSLTDGPIGNIKTINVSTVNVEGVMVKNQDDNVFTIAFTVVNRGGAQPKVIYAVDLLQKDENGTFVFVDQKVYDKDVLSLIANDSLQQSVTYTAPKYLKGKYILQIEIRNPDGLMFGMTQIKNEIVLNGTNEYVQIDQANCFLTVDNEEGDKHYNIGQGVDIAKTETLTAHCSIMNTASVSQTVIPTFQTRYRTTFGKLMGIEKQAPMILRSNQKIDFTAKIPKMIEPQAYDAVLTFVTLKNQQISSPLVFHYILAGESATIQNLSLDKDSYLKGETAKVVFFWSGSADSFPGSRLSSTTSAKQISVLFTITDSQSNSCVAPYTKKLEAKKMGGMENIAIVVTKDCNNPIIKATIIGSGNKVLANNSYEIDSKNTTTQPITPEPKPKTNNFLVLGLYVLIGIFIAMLAVFFIKNK